MQAMNVKKHVVEERDIEAAGVYITPKPSAVSVEFKELAETILQEEGWHVGDNPEGAHELYLKLKDAI
jgi:hypothetical protein